MDEYNNVILGTSAGAAPDLGCAACNVSAELGRLPEKGKAFRVAAGDTQFLKQRDKRYLQYGYPGKNRADNHLQGVQRHGDYLYVTGADLTEKVAHLFVVRLTCDASGTPTKGKVERILAIDTALPHPGGLQRLGDVLAIPLQGEGDASQVIFIQVADPQAPVFVGGKSTIVRPGRPKAGAAALARLPDGRLLAGAWWEGSKRLLDLYLSKGAELRGGFLGPVSCDFTAMTKPAPAYQSIAFLNPEPWQPSGGGPPGVRLWMVGLRNTMQKVSDWAKGENWADLVELRIPHGSLTAWPNGPQVQTELRSSKRFRFGDKAGNFSAAAGVNVEKDGRLTLYAAHHWRLDREFRFSACC